MKQFCLVVAAFAAAGAIPALADVRIAVQLDTQPVLTPSALVFPDNTPIAISLADLLDNTATPAGPYRLTIWMFDDGVFQGQQSVPTARLPALTITAAPTDTLPEQLDILVLGPRVVGSSFSFPPMPESFVEDFDAVVGLAFLGSLQVQIPGGDADELRSRVRLAGRVLGNIGRDPNNSGGIRDEIHVGQIWRLEALTNNVAPVWATGNVRANIRTSGRWVDPRPSVADLNAIGIGVLSADYGIDGDIRTGSRPRRQVPNGFEYPKPDEPDFQAFNPGHIRRISVERQVPDHSLGLVGSTLTAGNSTIQLIDGVPLDARLPGSIGEVYSAGPFGTAQRPIKLDAGDTIHYVRAVHRIVNTDLFELGEQSIYADVFTGTAVLSFPPVGVTADPTSNSIAGALQRLETGGDFVGSLVVGNMTTLSNRFFRFNGFPTEPLQDRHVSPFPEISSIRQSGILLRGSLVGSLTVRGLVEYADIIAESFTMPLSIGHMLKGSVVAYGDPSNAPGAGHLAGLSVGLAPVLENEEINARQPGFCGVAHQPTAMDLTNDTPETVWFRPTVLDSGSMDGLVRAATAGPLSFAAVSNRHFRGGGTKNRPRIEVVSGQSLSIDVLHCGLVWSGRLEYQPGTRALINDPTNDFASFGSITIGCVGASSDLWFTGTPHLSIANDVRGQIRTNRLQTNQLITVGGTLAPRTDFTFEPGLTCASVDSFADLSPEASPRGLHAEADDSTAVAPHGAIYIREPLGLAGQITLEANNTTAVHDTSRLAGFVRVGGFKPIDGVTLATATSTASGTTPDATLPFYSLTSAQLGGGAVGVVPFAVHLADSPAVTGADNIFPPFTLPTTLRTTGLPLRYYGPVTMTVPQPTGTITSRGNGTFGPFLPPNSGQNFTGSAAGRTMTLTATQSSQILPLEYRAVPDTFGVQSLVTLPTGLVTRNTLADKAVYYRIGCGFGGNPNPADVTGIGGPPAAPDNQVTGDDFNAFIAAFAAEDLLADLTGIGGPPALPDGLITGDDFNAFIAAFIAGCEQ